MWVCFGREAKVRWISKQKLKCKGRAVATGCGAQAWMCSLVPTLVTKEGRSLCLTALECFYMWLACALEHYCHPTVVERVPAAGVTVPLLVYVSVWTEECPSCGLFTKQLFSYFPDDMLTQLLQAFLLPAETQSEFTEVTPVHLTRDTECMIHTLNNIQSCLCINI